MTALIGTAAADEPVKKVIGAQFFNAFTSSETGCELLAQIQFPSMPGATHYVISYYDNYWKQVISHTAPNPQQFTDKDAKAGTHRISVAGTWWSPPCGDIGNGYKGRFVRTTATAYFPPKYKPQPEIWGKVSVRLCSKTGCRVAGLRGVTITANPIGTGRLARTTTDADGEYRLKVTKGRYRVVPSYSGADFDPANKIVVAEGFGPRNVNFLTCNEGSDARAALASASVGPRADPFCRLLHVESDRATRDKAAVAFLLTGEGWNPKGGPIRLFFDRELIGTLPQGDTFKGRFSRDHWNQRNTSRDENPGCGGVLSAIQGAYRRSVPVVAPAVGIVLATDLDARIRASQAFCYKEDAWLKQTLGTIVALRKPDGAILIFQAGSATPPIIVQQSLCVGLTRGRGSVLVTRRPNGVIVASKRTRPC